MTSTEIALLLNSNSEKITWIGEIIGKKIEEKDNFENLNEFEKTFVLIDVLEHNVTTYLTAADKDGMMVSFIQSNYQGFGSGVVVPGRGISMQNRGYSFSLEAGHLNEAAPAKRPYHTIIPGFLTRGNEAVGPFGVMGGFMQPPCHLQVVAGTVDHNLNAQAVLSAPRWRAGWA